MGAFDDLIPGGNAPAKGGLFDDLVQKPRSALGEIGSQLKAGVVAEVPQQLGQAIQYISDPGRPLYEYGKGVADRAKARGEQPEYVAHPDEHNAVTNALAGGARMLAPSIAAPAAVAAAATALPVSGPVAAGIGATLGVLPTAFQQGQQTLDKAREAGVPDEVAIPAARKTAAIEGAGEMVGNLAGAGALGALRKVGTQGVLKPFAKSLGIEAVAEPATEYAQQYGEAAVEKAAGIDTQDPHEAGLEVIPPTLGMVGLMAPLGLAGHALAARRKPVPDSAATDAAITDQNASTTPGTVPGAQPEAGGAPNSAGPLASNEASQSPDVAPPPDGPLTRAAKIAVGTGATEAVQGQAAEEAIAGQEEEAAKVQEKASGDAIKAADKQHGDEERDAMKAVEQLQAPRKEGETRLTVSKATARLYLDAYDRMIERTNQQEADRHLAGDAERAEALGRQLTDLQKGRKALAKLAGVTGEKAKPKETTNAVPIESPGSVLQRQPGQDGSAGGERGRVESGVQGQSERPSAENGKAPTATIERPGAKSAETGDVAKANAAPAEAAAATRNAPVEAEASKPAAKGGDRVLSEAAEDQRKFDIAERTRNEREAAGLPPLKPLESLPAAIKRLGREKVDALIGDWDGNANLHPDGDRIVAPNDYRNPSSGSGRVSTKEFMSWLAGHPDGQPSAHPTDAAAHEAATSPTNKLPEPSAEQAKAGNYQKGHIAIGGLDISIENPQGSFREDKEHTPPQWRNEIKNAHYGYVRSVRGGAENASDRLAADAKLFGDSGQADAIRAKGFDSLDAQNKRVVQASVVSGLHDGEVFRNVVESVPVSVVHMLVGKKVATEHLLHDKAMLFDRLSASLDDPVVSAPIGRFIDAVAAGLPRALARLGAEKQAALGVGKPVGTNAESGAAGRAGNGEHGRYFSPKGADGDHVDVFVKPGTADDYAGDVYVVDQQNKAGAFDEHKVMIGYPSQLAATQAYRSNYPKDFKVGPITKTTMPEFKGWLANSDTTKPFAETKAPFAETKTPEAGTIAAPSETPAPLIDRPTLKERQAANAWDAANREGAPETLTLPMMNKGGDYRGVPSAHIQIQKYKDGRYVYAASYNTNISGSGGPLMRRPSDKGYASRDEALRAAIAEGREMANSKGAASGASNAAHVKHGVRLHRWLDSIEPKASPTSTHPGPSTEGAARPNLPIVTETATPVSKEVKASDVGKMSADDFESLIDEVLAEKKAEPASPTPKPTLAERNLQKTGGQILGEAAGHAKEGIGSGLKGLDALFGRKGTLGSAPNFDEDTWAKAKPHFNQAFDEFVAAGKSLKEFVRYILDAYNETIRPYLSRWYKEKAQEASNEPTEKPTDVVQPGVAHGAGASTLEGVPSGEIRDLRQSGHAGSELEGGGESYVAGNGGRPFGGLQPTGSLGHGEPALHLPKAGTRPPGEPYEPARNFVITDALGIGKGGAVQKYNDNVAAIKLLKQLDADSRQATAAEQAVLARYVGWGGIKQVFPKPGSPAPQGWEARAAEIRELLTPEEHEAASRSIQDAHFTSMDVVDASWAIARRLGFDGGKVLEDSMGSGNFFGRMPVDLRDASSLTGIELDSLTARIAKQLYPQANILGPIGFHEVTLADEHNNLNMGNPPFGNQELYDPTAKHLRGFSIHNYFFAKAIDKLAPGGLHIQVVSRYLMDAKNTTAREYIAHRAELVGAIRLPWTAFKENANTEVVTDIVILQKLPQSKWGSADRAWIDTTEIPDPSGKEAITVNQYYADNPDMIVGQIERSGKMVPGGSDVTVQPNKGEELALGLRRAIESLPSNIYWRGKLADQVRDEEFAAVEGADEHDVGAFFEQDGKVYRRVATPDGSIKAEQITAETPWSEKQQWGDTRVERLLGMIGIRSQARRLLKAEAHDEPKMTLDALRARLNQLYDTFRAKYGYLNDQANERVFHSDPDTILLALEDKYDRGVTPARAKTLGVPERPASAEKMPIFHQRVVMAHEVPTHVDSVRDAVTVSLHERGGVSVQFISDLTGKSPDEVISEITGGDNPIAFMDPAAQKFILAAEYLSGNVKKKHAEARDAGMTKNADALKAVFPPDLKAGDIRPRLGAPWIDSEAYGDFAKHLFGPSTTANIQYVPATGGFVANIAGGDQTMLTTRWGVQKADRVDPQTGAITTINDGRSGDDILVRVLNSRELTVWHTDQEGNRYSHQEVTQALAERASEMHQEFENFAFADLKRRERLVNFYNDNFNTNVDPKIDGSYLELPGKVPDTVIAFRRSQKNAVARVIRYQKVLLDHVVGAGKTFTAAAAAMEQRRLGLKKKPMFVVPNHLVKQWATAFYQLYPGAKILAMRKADFAKLNRRRMLARVATGDYDAVIFSHSSFGFIPNEKELVIEHIARQVEEIQAAIDAAREVEGKKSKTAAQFQKQKERLQERLKRIADAPKDNILTFQELGVDMLYLDESQEYKNLFFTTGKRGVGGFGNPTGSKRAFDMFIKTKWLQDANSGNGVAFLTGTPISNSLTELYTLQRYLGLEALEARGLHSLDAWLNTFGVIESEYEANVTGTRYKRKERLRRLTNVPEAMQMYKSFADSVSLDDIKRNYSEDHAGAEFPVPKVKGGKRQNVTVEASLAQKTYSAELQDRMEHLTGDTRRDNALKILTDGRKAALDIRLKDRSQPDNPTGKTHTAADQIKRLYDENTHRAGTQLVFLDLSTPIKHGKKAALGYLKEARELLENPGAYTYGTLTNQWERLREALIERMHTVDENDDGEEDRIGKIEEFLAQSDDVDAAVGTADSGFSVYDDLRQKLIDRDIPPKQIAFIHDYNTENQKQDLFDQVNAGSIRVLMGSTSKMGAGTNVQRKAVALHHLDVPWRPSDIEQREGRIIRQGNEFRQADPNFEVEILAYATVGTSDVFFWQTQEQKLNGINSLRNFKGEREIEEVSADAMTAAEMKALASGNPLILEDVSLTDAVRKLESAQRRHVSNQQDLESQVAKYQRQIAGLPKIIEDQTALVDKIDTYRDDPFEGKPRPTVVIDGKTMTGQDAREHVRAAIATAEQRATENNAPATKRVNEIASKQGDIEERLIRENPNLVVKNDPHRTYIQVQKAAEKDSGWLQLQQERAQLEKDMAKPEWGVTIGGKIYHSTEGAIKAIVREAGDIEPFRAVLHGKEFIRREDAAAFIDPIVKDMEKAGAGATDLGTIAGIPIHLNWAGTIWGRGVEINLGFADHHQLTAFMEDKAETKYVSASPVTGERALRGIERLMLNAQSDRDANQKALKAAQDGIEPVSAQVGRPWGKEEELAAKRARLTQVRSELAGTPTAQAAALTVDDLNAILTEDQKAEAASAADVAEWGPEAADHVISSYREWTKHGRPTDIAPEALDLYASIRGATPKLSVAIGERTYGGALGAGDVRELVNRFVRQFGNAPKINVRPAVTQFPFFKTSQRIKDAIMVRGQVRGAYWNGEIWLAANALKDKAAVEFVIGHELGHYGLDGLGVTRTALEQIYATNPALRAAADKKMADLGYDKALATEEALADMAGRGEWKNIAGWRMLFARIRTALRNMGFKVDFSDNDIAALLAQTRRFVQERRQASAAKEGAHPKLSSEHGVVEWAQQRVDEARRAVDAFYHRFERGERDFMSVSGYHGDQDPYGGNHRDERERLHKELARAEAYLSRQQRAQPKLSAEIPSNTPAAQAQRMHSAIFDGSRNFLSDMLRSDRFMNRLGQKWHTPAHIAETQPAFAPVYRAAQDYLHELNSIARAAQSVARNLMVTIESFRDFGKKSPHNADVRAAHDALMYGTLYGGGNPMEGERWTHEELRTGRVQLRDKKGQFTGVTTPARFAPMNDEQIKLYDQALDSVGVSLNEYSKSLIWRIAELQGMALDKDAIRAASLDQAAAAVKDKAQEQIDAIRFRQSLQPDKKAAARAEAEIAGWQSFTKEVDSITDKTMKLLDHGYFPAMRFGDYAVNVQRLDDKGRWHQVAFHRFDGQFAANRARREIAAAHGAKIISTTERRGQLQPGTYVVSDKMNTHAYRLFNGLNLDALQVFADHIRGEDGLPVSKDPVMQEYFRIALSERSSLKQHIHRKGTPGWSTDVGRVLANFTTSHAASSSRNYYAGKMLRATQDIKQSSGDLYQYATDYVKYLQDPNEESHGLRAFLAHYYILGSLAFGAVNMTQPVLITAPYLTKWTGYADAIGKLGAAATDYTRGRRGTTEQEKADYARAVAEGHVAPQEIHQIRADSQASMLGDSRVYAKLEEWAQSVGVPLPSKLSVRKASFLWGSIYSMTEQFNRGVTFLAALRIAREKGIANPYEFAVSAIASTQFTYNRANRPEFARGPIGSVLMTFKTFNISYFELFQRLMKLENKKPAALMMLTLFALAGTEGLPFAEDIEDLIDTIGQWMGYSTNTKKTARLWMERTLTPNIANVLLHGVSGVPGVPIDVAQRMGFQNLIPGTALLKTSEPDATRDVLEMMGPAATLFQNLKSATEPGQSIVRAISPVAVQNVLKGAEMLQTGQYRDMRERKVIDTTPVDAAFKMVGFQPQLVAQAQRVYGQNQQDLAQHKVVEDSIVLRLATAIVDNNPDLRAKAMEDWQDWNKKNPAEVIRITPAQIQTRARNMAQSREQRQIKGAPVELRAEIAQSYRPQ